ncbi:TPA: hypothetical protein QEF70_002710 [Stenotrophomonas maltophilia]|nr:hypothetical protein [Stenotrophomonas maltophilia]
MSDIDQTALEIAREFVPMDIEVKRRASLQVAIIEAIKKHALALNVVPPSQSVNVFAVYETWPDDLKAKLSLHDLRRMNGWAPRTKAGDWRIDTSAGGPILVYKDCSVIEGEDARYVLSLIERDSRQPATQAGPEVTL